MTDTTNLTVMDNERKTLENALNSLKARMAVEMHGRMVPTPRAQKLAAEIARIKEDIHLLDKRAAEIMAIDKAPAEEMLEILALPLLADVMNDITVSINANLRKAGLPQSVFADIVSQIRTLSVRLVDTFNDTDPNEPLPPIADEDDHLVGAIRKKLMTYIKQRVRITKQSNGED